MNSFPFIKNEIILSCFDEITHLYSNDQQKLIDAAVSATSGTPTAIVATAHPINNQITSIRNKVRRTADKVGQTLMINWIEKLYENISNIGVVGVTTDNFLDTINFKLPDEGQIKFETTGKWVWTSVIKVEENEYEAKLGLRCDSNPQKEIVKDYILQYVQQAISAYKNNRRAAALALMTIALEGTLRDALQVKGYTYSFGNPPNDVYQLEPIQIHPDPNGFKVTFPNPMPINLSLIHI